MGRVEYKVEQVQWKDEPESRLDQLVEHLNAFARDGWRVVSVDLMAHNAFATKTLPVLLERGQAVAGATLPILTIQG